MFTEGYYFSKYSLMLKVFNLKRKWGRGGACVT